MPTRSILARWPWLLAVTLFGVTLSLGVSCSKNSGGTAVDDDEDENDAPPSDVADLAVTSVTPTTANLRWSAPHGGNPTLLVQGYDVRYALNELTAMSWPSAMQAANEPAPLPPGMQQVMILTGLVPGSTYAIGLKAVNAAGEWSHLSNIYTTTLPLDQVVVFQDAALDSVIRGIIQKPSGELHASDLVTVTEVEANDLGITDLSGIEACTALRFLHVSNNQISDLHPVQGLLQLYSLGLWANQISDLNPLRNLVGLVQLSLGSNQIEDLQWLANLTALEYLSLSSNRIVDVGHLSRLVNLTTLQLNANQISDIARLVGLTNIQSIQLDYNLIHGLRGLVDNPGIGGGDEVYVRGNPLLEEALQTDIPALEARGVTVYH